MFSSLGDILTSPLLIVLMFGSTLLGIFFGALPGLTATLGVALLHYHHVWNDLETALISLFGIYIGAINAV